MIKIQENIDYLAEVVVSHLVANKKISESNVYVHLTGVFRRFFSKEIERIDVHRNDEGNQEWNVFLQREGLYDMLPEGFFHSNTQKYFKERKETINEFRIHKEEERRARLFFMPLEQEFFRYNIYREIFEQNFFYSPETIQEFIDFFDLNHLDLNLYQKASLFFILPHIPKITGNLSLIETCFSIILQEKVVIETVYRPSLLTYDNISSALGSNTLAYNSLLGDSVIDNNPGLIIEIGPLADSNSLLSYLSGIKRKVILRLTELFIQADLTITIQILLNKQDRIFVLGEKNFESRLDYSTYI
jgi:type VI secretion system protein ImpH